MCYCKCGVSKASQYTFPGFYRSACFICNGNAWLIIATQNDLFGDILESACLAFCVSVRPCGHVSVRVRNTSFCQSAGGGI